MSRLVAGYDGMPVAVTTNGEGTPLTVADSTVRQVLEHRREWIGVLDGEPQRDVWLVDTEDGVCEVHYVAFPIGDDAPLDGTWLLARWLD